MNDRDTMALALSQLVEAVSEYRISDASSAPTATAYLDEILGKLASPADIAGRAILAARASELEAIADSLRGGESARVRQAMRGLRIALLDRAQDLRGVTGRPIGERAAKARRS